MCDGIGLIKLMARAEPHPGHLSKDVQMETAWLNNLDDCYVVNE